MTIATPAPMVTSEATKATKSEIAITRSLRTGNKLTTNLQQTHNKPFDPSQGKSNTWQTAIMLAQVADLRKYERVLPSTPTREAASVDEQQRRISAPSMA